MKRKTKKGLVSLFSIACALSFGLGVGNNLISQAAEVKNEPKLEAVSGGVNVTLTPEEGQTQVSFDYWNYVNVNELLGGELLQMKMTPFDVYTAEAQSVVVTLKDIVNPTQCISIVVHTSNSYWGMNGTYAKVALTDTLTVGNSVTISGTPQNVVGKTELVNGNADVYTNYGALDIGNWDDDKNGVFSAGQPSEKLPDGKPISSLHVTYENHTVKAGAAKFSGGNLVMRTLANLNSDEYFAASTNMLTDEHEALKALYTSKHVENLFSSGYATLSFKFGGVSGDKVSFCIEEVGGAAVTEYKDTTAPILIPALKTQALQGKAYNLPEVSIYENWDKDVTDYELRVKSPSGANVAVENGAFSVTETGVYTLTYTVQDNAGNLGEYVYEVTSYTSLPSVQFKPLTPTLPQENYLVKEQLIVPAMQAYSLISREQDNALKTTAILYKDGKSVKTIEDVTTDQSVELTETGEYEIVYLAENAYGIIVSQSMYRFTVEDKPIIIPAKSEYFWQHGKMFTIPNEFCYYKGSKNLADVCVYSPNGELINCNGNVLLTEAGTYTLVYTYEMGGMKAEAEVPLHSADLANSLFKANEKVEFKDNYKYPSWAKNNNQTGLFVGLNEETSISYKQEVDLDELDKDTPLLRMLPYNNETETYGKYSFQVILTSVDDPSQKIAISVKPHSDMWQYAYTHVNYDGRTLALDTEYNKITSLEMFGCLMRLSIGQGYGQANVWDYSLFYEPTEKAFYINSNLTTDPWKLLDLDDAAHVGVGKEWAGFPSSRVMLELNFYSFDKEKAATIITEIAGQSLGSAIVNDQTAPKLYFDYPETFVLDGKNLPFAEVGKSYSLLQATAYDLVNGSCKVSYGLFFENSSENLYEGATHTFTQAGKYKYVISSQDLSGNVNAYEYLIEVKEAVDPIAVSFGDYQAPVAGTWFTLPEITVSGGSGKILLTKEIKLGNETLTENALNEVYLNGCGTLTIKVFAQDYLNTPIGGMDTLTITVADSSKPTLTIGGVPESALAGKTVRFNDFTSMVYQNNSVSESEYRAIIVDGLPIYEVKGGVVSGSLTYANMKTEGSLSVRYVAGTSEQNILAEESFEIPVRSIVYVNELLQPYNYDESCVNTTMQVTRDTKGSYFTFSGNKGLKLINPAVADGFLIKLGGMAENYQGQEIRITMTDYYNDRIGLSFTLKMDSGKCYMLIGEKTVLLDGTLDNIEALIAIEYDEDSKGFLNASGDLLVLVTKTAQGLDFNGFTSGLITVKIEMVVPMENVGNIYTLLIRELGNTSFAAANNDVTYSDLTGPAIGFKGVIRSDVYKLGDELYIPVAMASDMVTGETEVRVTVRDIWYNAIEGYDNVILTEGKILKLETYGVYTVTYTARDGNGRTGERTFIMMVQDTTPPTLTVTGGVDSEMKVGDTCKTPTFEAIDDNSSVTKKIYVYCPDGSVVDITEAGKYKINYAGTYILQIYCYDEDGNVAQKIFEIKAK